MGLDIAATEDCIGRPELPLYCHVLAKLFPDTKVEDHTKQILVTAKQKKTLDDLVWPDNLRNAVSTLIGLDKHKTPNKLDAQAITNMLRGKCSAESAQLLANCADTLEGYLFGFLNRKTALFDSLKSLKEKSSYGKYEKVLYVFLQYQEQSASSLYTLRNNKIMREGLEVLQDLAKKSEHIDPEIFKQFRLGLICVHEQTMNELLLLKIKRTKALKKINQEIALSYLCFFFVDTTAKVVIKNGSAAEQLSGIFSPGSSSSLFWEADQCVYESIINNLYVIPKHTASAEAGESMPRPQELREKDMYNSLKKTIITQKSARYYTRDMLLRVEYFVQENIRSAGLHPEGIRQLAESFSGFEKKLARDMRRHDNRPSELELRTFFDDVYLQLMREKRAIPTAEELQTVYKQVRREFSEQACEKVPTK